MPLTNRSPLRWLISDYSPRGDGLTSGGMGVGGLGMLSPRGLTGAALHGEQRDQHAAGPHDLQERDRKLLTGHGFQQMG